jgi:hypothetical protein
MQAVQKMKDTAQLQAQKKIQLGKKFCGRVTLKPKQKHVKKYHEKKPADQSPAPPLRP